jgi:hypothetical protein
MSQSEPLTKIHEVRPGECVLSIAAEARLPWQKIWYHPENEELRNRRKLGNILYPGDRIAIPEPEIGLVQGETEKRHKFCLRNNMVELRIRVHDLDGPRAKEPYHIEIGGRVYRGQTLETDADGMAICRVPATAEYAELIIGKNEDVYELMIGHMDPIDTVTGIHGRLQNMGFEVGGVHSPYDDQSAEAMAAFLLEQKEDLNKRNVADPDNQENQSILKAAYSN